MLNLSDELQPFLEQKFPLLRVHRYDGNQCTCKNPDCRWDAEKGGTAGKHPAERNGVHGAVPRDSANIFKGLNAGVACGRGFVVLDIDPRNGGDKSLARLIAANETLPRTWQVASGGGGTHYYFKVDGEQRGGKRVDGVDLIGLGGYVLAPGSVHPSQKQYEWEVHPSECEIAPLPEWVITECCRPKISQSIKREFEGSIYDEQDVADILKVLDPSVNNENWVKVGMALKDGGYSIDVFDDWSKQGRNYAGRKDVEVRWNSFKDKEDGVHFGSLIHWGREANWIPREIEKWKWLEPAVIVEPKPREQNKKEISFPRGLVGENAKDIYDVAMWKEKRFALAASEAQMSGIAQGGYVTPMDSGPMGLYTMLITRSGGGKADYTKAFDRCIMATDPILDMGEVASPQALRRVLEQCNSRVLGLDEGVKWLTSLVESKDANNQKLYSDFLSAWSGSKLNTITTKDATNNSPAVLNPKVTILGAGPRDAFLRLLQNGGAIAADGLLSRFDFIMGNADMPENFIKKRRFVVSDSMAREFKAILRGSTGQNVESGRDVDPGGKQISDTLHFEKITHVEWTEQAERAFNDFAKFCCVRQNETGLYSVWSRVAEKALRSASAIAIGINPRKPVIDLDTLEWAVDYKKNLAFETEAICQEYLNKSVEMLCREKIVEAAKRNGGAVTLGKIQAYWQGFRSVPQLTVRQAIERLEAEGTIAPLQKTRRGAVQIQLLRID